MNAISNALVFCLSWFWWITKLQIALISGLSWSFFHFFTIYSYVRTYEDTNESIILQTQAGLDSNEVLRKRGSGTQFHKLFDYFLNKNLIPWEFETKATNCLVIDGYVCWCVRNYLMRFLLLQYLLKRELLIIWVWVRSQVEIFREIRTPFLKIF